MRAGGVSIYVVCGSLTRDGELSHVVSSVYCVLRAYQLYPVCNSSDWKRDATQCELSDPLPENEARDRSPHGHDPESQFQFPLPAKGVGNHPGHARLTDPDGLRTAGTGRWSGAGPVTTPHDRIDGSLVTDLGDP